LGRRLNISISVAGLVLAALGIFVPIVWEQLKGNTQLLLVKQSESQVLTYDKAIGDLEVKYKGRSVASLVRTVFVLKNSGNRPIERSDLVLPVTIALTSGAIIDAAIQEPDPKNVVTSLAVQKNQISLLFDLLNPGDSFRVVVLADAEKFTYVAECRVKNVKELLIQEAKEKIDRPAVTWVFWIVAFFAILLFLAGISLLREHFKTKRIAKVLRDEEFVRTHLSSRQSLLAFASTLTFLSGAQKAQNTILLEELEKDESDYHLEDLLKRFEANLLSNNVFGSGTASLIISGVGIWYCVSVILAGAF
jgi:hypothetical protein